MKKERVYDQDLEAALVYFFVSLMFSFSMFIAVPQESNKPKDLMSEGNKSNLVIPIITQNEFSK